MYLLKRWHLKLHNVILQFTPVRFMCEPKLIESSLAVIEYN